MTVLLLKDMPQYSDVLRLPDSQSVTVRFVEPQDAEPLQAYFRSLSIRSRYNRFLGAMSELPPTELDHFIHVGEGDRFSVIAVMAVDGFDTIVGEARYAFDSETLRFGAALLKNLECRAAAFGASYMFGDTLRSNDAMIGLARKSGFNFLPSPGDWKLVRFEKHAHVEPKDIPCASWRLATRGGALRAPT